MSSGSSAITPRTTVIVCCFNSATRIAATLEILSAQQFAAAWEVFVVDNRSTDGTADIAKRSWSRPDIPLTVLYEERQGLVWARICGLRAARGEWICFVDDDNHLSADYLAIADGIFAAHPGIGLIGGEGAPNFVGGAPAWLTPEWFRSLAIGPQGTNEGVLPEQDYIYGAGMCIRRRVWSDIEKVDWQPLMQGRSGKLLLSGEDAEMCSLAFALGWRAYFCPRLRFLHLIPGNRLTWSYWLRLYEGFGRTAAAYNVLGDALRLRHRRAMRWAVLAARAGYALAHIPAMPVFFIARKVLPEGSRLAARSSFRLGYALHGVRGLIRVWRAQWWRNVR